MGDQAAEGTYRVVCPHCERPFEAELLTASSSLQSRGFKCPHCRLFVPLERSNGRPLDDAGA